MTLTRRELSIIVLVHLVTLVYGWPRGAAEIACKNLLPSHGNNRPKAGSSAPFILSQSHEDYTPGEKVKVTVTASDGASFKGAMVQAYDVNSHQPIGNFVDGPGLEALDSCSAIVNTDKRRGKLSSTFLWSAPSQSSGKVAFRATVVQGFSEFYSDIFSNIDENI